MAGKSTLAQTLAQTQALVLAPLGSRTVALALIFASMLACNPTLTMTQTRTDPKERAASS